MPAATPATNPDLTKSRRDTSSSGASSCRWPAWSPSTPSRGLKYCSSQPGCIARLLVLVFPALARSPDDRPVDHLRVFVEPRFVLDAARDHTEIACTTHALLGPETEFHPARQHHEDLLVAGADATQRERRAFIDHQTIISWSPTRIRVGLLLHLMADGVVVRTRPVK